MTSENFTLGFDGTNQTYFIATGTASESADIAGYEVAASGNFRVVRKGIKTESEARQIINELNA